MLTFMQKVDENDDARIKLMQKVIDYLIILRDHTNGNGGDIQDFNENLQELELY